MLGNGKFIHMEFHQKLQELRKQKGITQEELAKRLFVSRTAVSKWESGKGYPGIESLKAIAKFYSITVDQLLSADEVLTIAEEDGKQKESRLRDLVFGLMDVSSAMLLFLPFFAQENEGKVQAVSLLSLQGVQPYLKYTFMTLVLCTALFGILTLAMQGCTTPLWSKVKTKFSLCLGSIAVTVFIVSSHPYGAMFAFVSLLIKSFLLIKRQ